MTGSGLMWEPRFWGESFPLRMRQKRVSFDPFSPFTPSTSSGYIVAVPPNPHASVRGEFNSGDLRSFQLIGSISGLQFFVTAFIKFAPFWASFSGNKIDTLKTTLSSLAISTLSRSSGLQMWIVLDNVCPTWSHTHSLSSVSQIPSLLSSAFVVNASYPQR